MMDWKTFFFTLKLFGSKVFPKSFVLCYSVCEPNDQIMIYKYQQTLQLSNSLSNLKLSRMQKINLSDFWPYTYYGYLELHKISSYRPLDRIRNHQEVQNVHFMIDYLTDLYKQLKVLIMCLRSAFTIILFRVFKIYSHFITAYKKVMRYFNNLFIKFSTYIHLVQCTMQYMGDSLSVNQTCKQYVRKYDPKTFLVYPGFP